MLSGLLKRDLRVMVRCTLTQLQCDLGQVTCPLWASAYSSRQELSKMNSKLKNSLTRFPRHHRIGTSTSHYSCQTFVAISKDWPDPAREETDDLESEDQGGPV